MGYAIADLELTEPLGDLDLRPDQNGIALLLRLRGRPVHFSLHSLPLGAQLTGERIWQLAGREAGRSVLAQRIRDELAAPLETRPVDVTIAICTHGRPQMLANLLRSLRALRTTSTHPQLLVVDNAPPDGATRELVESFSDVRYALEERPGLDFARNCALRESRTTYVAFLDDDVTVDPGWLAGLEEAIVENPDAGALTGLVLPSELESASQVFFERRGGFRRGFQKLRYDGQDQPYSLLYPTGAGSFGAGANMVFRRQLALDLGGFDEALDTGPPLPGGGDLDMFYRVIRAGWPLCYEPALLVFHLHREQRVALGRQYWSWGEGLMAFLAKTYAADPSARLKVRGLWTWWLVYASHMFLAGVKRREVTFATMAAAEFAGGLVGMSGSYRRSRRRTERIRADHAR